MRDIRFHFFLIILAGIVVVLLYPRYYPLMGLDIRADKDEIGRKAREIASELSVETDGYFPVIKLEQNKAFIKYVQKRTGLQKANELLRNELNGYVYSVRWISANLFSNNEANDGNSAAQKIIKSFTLKFDTKGNLIQLQRTLTDTGAVHAVNKAEAARLADAFLQKYSHLRIFADSSALDSSVRVSGRSVDHRLGGADNTSRLDYEFGKAIPVPSINDTLDVRIALVGDQIVKLETDYTIPEPATSPAEIITIILTMLIYLGFFIALSILWFKRIRSYEIGFALGIKLAVLAAVATFLEILLRFSYPLYWGNIFEVIFGPIFLGVGIFILWITSESLIREVWNDKLLTVDLLMSGYMLDSHIGKSLIRGTAFGLSAMALFSVSVMGADRFFDVSLLHITDESLVFLTASEPVLYLVFRLFYYALAVALFSFLIIPGLMRKWVNIPAVYIGTAILVFALVFYDTLHPQWIGLLITAVVGAVFIYSVYKYDFLTVTVAFFVFSISKGSLFLVFNETTSGWIFIAGFLITIGYAVAAIMSRDALNDYERITPRYVKFINERQRLQRELEIAREVQMSFLPESMPEISGLEIAARCLPALEVGGDYYDFVRLSDDKLAVAIGDVSGKGTQAAFYMTLTKGFLRAVSRHQNSPKQILSEMNALFFENARRNTFISMVYALFDTGQKTVTLARAGHNPIIKLSPGSHPPQIIQPAGLALGLEKGDVFNEKIEEVVHTLQKGDVYIFYTDGLNEAMNNTEEEFGEERLLKLVAQYRHSPAQDILDRIYADVNKFAGKSGQRDDMTVVVIKVRDV